jgi:hypothetical protein
VIFSLKFIIFYKKDGNQAFKYHNVYKEFLFGFL